MSRRNFVIHHPPSPTYFPPQARAPNPSTIDIVLINNLPHITGINSIATLSSDHNPIEFSINLSAIKTIQTKLRFDLANWNIFQKYISDNTNLNGHISAIPDIDNAISYFSELVNTATNLFIPKKPFIANSTALPTRTRQKISLSET